MLAQQHREDIALQMHSIKRRLINVCDSAAEDRGMSNDVDQGSGEDHGHTKS
jgi:hypothetical protein